MQGLQKNGVNVPQSSPKPVNKVVGRKLALGECYILWGTLRVSPALIPVEPHSGLNESDSPYQVVQAVSWPSSFVNGWLRYKISRAVLQRNAIRRHWRNAERCTQMECCLSQRGCLNGHSRGVWATQTWPVPSRCCFSSAQYQRNSLSETQAPDQVSSTTIQLDCCTIDNKL